MGVEVKASATVVANDFFGLRKLADASGKHSRLGWCSMTTTRWCRSATVCLSCLFRPCGGRNLRRRPAHATRPRQHDRLLLSGYGLREAAPICKNERVRRPRLVRLALPQKAHASSRGSSAELLRDFPYFPGLDACNGRPTQVDKPPEIRLLQLRRDRTRLLSALTRRMSAVRSRQRAPSQINHLSPSRKRHSGLAVLRADYQDPWVPVRSSSPCVDPACVPNPSDPAADSVLVHPGEYVNGMLATHLLDDGLCSFVQHNNTRLPVLVFHRRQDRH